MNKCIPEATSPSFGVGVRSQRKGLLGGPSPPRPGQVLLCAHLGLASLICPFCLPLPCTVAQPHLGSPSPGPEPSKATLQSDACLSNKLPGQPCRALRFGIWQNRSQPQTCRQHTTPRQEGVAGVSLTRSNHTEPSSLPRSKVSLPGWLQLVKAVQQPAVLPPTQNTEF